MCSVCVCLTYSHAYIAVSNIYIYLDVTEIFFCDENMSLKYVLLVVKVYFGLLFIVHKFLFTDALKV